MLYTYHYHSQIGTLEIKEENEHIIGVRLLAGKEEIAIDEFQLPLTPLLQQVHLQLTEYFSGIRTTFTLPIAYPHGTPFQQSVWNALRDIPYGETRSYEDIARAINKNGTIGGFGCGVEVKRKLLELEGVNIK